MKRVLIEGWRGINHSVAMVNQYQLLELSKVEGLKLAHRDLPFFNAAWNSLDNPPGFAETDQTRLEAIPLPDDDPYDVVYRIGAPIRRSRTVAGKVITFMQTEFGLLPNNFAEGDCEIDFYVQRENGIVVSSNWTKARLEEFGFPADKLYLVPHGVDSRIFCPLEQAVRQAVRKQLGLEDEHFAFLNLGAMTWNKGVDLLVRAFAEVRKAHPNARLVLKDSKQLYGFGVQDMLQDVLGENPGLITEEMRASIVLISSTLPVAQVRLLYAAVDSYVSPYRAEGFNLPVIEAIASGTPAIVTSGGPTDDFCNDQVALRVESNLADNRLRSIRDSGFHLEPKLDSLIEQMEAVIQGKGIPQAVFTEGRGQLIEKNSWRACTEQLVALF
jgi:glycosyltransferase involved in cell wall biosynthesis